jgi:transposase
MAMGAVKGQESTLQVAMVCLDELVPEDCGYRKLDRLVDWSFVREAARPYYAEDVGRPSIDPIVLVKLMVAAALEGIGSTREFCRVAGLRLDLRRFLGYGFHERLPVHQTLSHAQTRRFVDGALFERLFLRSLDLCKQHGLVEGSHLSVDGFHAEANAALASLRASLALVAVDESGEEKPGEAEPPPLSGPPQLSLAEPRSGRTPKRRSSNRTSVSRTDPDAKLRGKPGQRPHLVFRGQVAVDPKTRCVVACLGEEADGYEGDALDPILDRARFACPELASVGADSGFAAERVWRGLQDRGLGAYIPPQPTMLPTGEPTTEAQRQALAARGARVSAASGRTSSGWLTPRASSANSRITTGSTASARAERRSSTSSSCSAAPPSTTNGSPTTSPRRSTAPPRARQPLHATSKPRPRPTARPRAPPTPTRPPPRSLPSQLAGATPSASTDFRATAGSDSWTGP